MSYRHAIRVRFGEVDHQGVVFNAHYLAYIDDTLENWVAEDEDLKAQHGWDMMLKKVELVWMGSVGNGDVLVIDAAVERFGSSSWTVRYVGTHEGDDVFEATVTYVSVVLGENAAQETPQAIRDYLQEERVSRDVR